ncbi:FGGY-family carbohydrate kinase [Nocardioides sp. SLBN-35]|uniref:FGGY-family carbohydrate kinase n=1 Tax=Nocardioides sp. SLBN-35 TaxID=2768445 RepID=UPI0011514F72|nr:FGGY-family carbohydrate kinase [Nocardioides sp. SLBN-35]
MVDPVLEVPQEADRVEVLPHEVAGIPVQTERLGVDHDTISALALESPSGAQGVSLLPYYGGERTPNRPEAVGTWTGLRTRTTRADLARAAFESLACSLTEAVGQLTRRLDAEPARVLLVGGAARSEALRVILAGVLGRPVLVAEPAEYVAIGAARQAAWTLTGAADPPPWPAPRGDEVVAPATAEVLERYALLRERTQGWEPGAHGRAD